MLQEHKIKGPSINDITGMVQPGGGGGGGGGGGRSGFGRTNLNTELKKTSILVS